MKTRTLLMDVQTIKTTQTVDLFPGCEIPHRHLKVAESKEYRVHCKCGSQFNISEDIAEYIHNAIARRVGQCKLEVEISRPKHQADGLYMTWQANGDDGCYAYEDDETVLYVPICIENTLPKGTRMLFKVTAVSHPAAAPLRKEKPVERKWECICGRKDTVCRDHIHEDPEGTWKVTGFTCDLFGEGGTIHLVHETGQLRDTQCPVQMPPRLIGGKVFVDPVGPAN